MIRISIIPLILIYGGWGDVILVTSTNSKFSNISESKLYNLYLGREKFVNGKRIILTDNNISQNDFFKRYLRKSEREYKAVWRMKMFTGKAMQPKKFTSTEELLKYIMSNTNSLAYIDETLLKGGLKRVSIGSMIASK